MDPNLLSGFIAKNNITMMSCSPLMLNGLNREENLEAISHVDRFLSGGDVLKKSYMEKLLSLVEIYNTYGPTETTVCATYYKCSSRDESNIPIGKLS